MSGQQIGTVVGGIVGAYFGMPQLGMAIGGLIGGAIDPTKINGPHIGDGQTQTATDGSPIAWVVGTAWVAGCIVQVGKRREVKVKDSGKGGPEVSHYEAHQDFAILICESSETRGSTISQVLMIEQDGKIVYDMRSGSTMIGDSQKYAANVDFLYGGESQMPHPTLEAISGVGNTVAYRGSCVAVFKDFNLSGAGDRIPTFRFLVQARMARLSFPDFTLGISNPSAVAVDASGIQNKDNHVSTKDYWNYPIPSDANGLVATFRLLQLGDGDSMTVGLSDATHKHIIDFQPNTEGVIDSLQRPAMNYFASDFYGQSRYLAPSALAVGVNYTVLLTFNDDDTYTCVLSRDGMMVGTATASRMQQTAPAFLAFGRTANAYSPTTAIARYTSVQVFAGSTANLAGIISALCRRGGLPASVVDVSKIGQKAVEGYIIANQSTASDCLLTLLQAYFAYGTEFDGRLHFDFYGQDAQITVDPADILEATDANENSITKTVRNQATEFPRKITVTYYDPDQNYMAVDTSAERSAADVIAIGEIKISMPVAIDGDSAAQAAQKALKIAYAKLEGTRDYCVPFARSAPYITVCAGEPVLMDGKRWVLDEVDLSTGYLKFSSRYDRQSAYRSNLQVIKGLPPSTPTSRYSGPTTLIPMNLPSLRPQDTYGLYLAAASATGSAAWKGCTVQVSFDNQQTWQVALTITEGSTLGKVVDNEPSGGEPLIVDVDGTGDLASATPDQLAANANAFALVNGATAEIGQFETAEQDSDGNYFLTGVSRGLNGTIEVPAVADQQFTMLDSVYFLPIDLSFKGKTIALRAVGFNEVAEDQPVVTIVYNPDTTVIHDGGTVS